MRLFNVNTCVFDSTYLEHMSARAFSCHMMALAHLELSFIGSCGCQESKSSIPQEEQMFLAIEPTLHS